MKSSKVGSSPALSRAERSAKRVEDGDGASLPEMALTTVDVDRGRASPRCKAPDLGIAYRSTHRAALRLPVGCIV